MPIAVAPFLLLQLAETPALDPLPLPVTVNTCPPGYQPNRAQDTCIECGYGTFNFDGAACLNCPEGALPVPASPREAQGEACCGRWGCPCKSLT